MFSSILESSIIGVLAENISSNGAIISINGGNGIFCISDLELLNSQQHSTSFFFFFGCYNDSFTEAEASVLLMASSFDTITISDLSISQTQTG